MSCLIVTHCYAEKLKQYARFLEFQMESLIRHPTTMPVSLHVYTTGTDDATLQALTKHEERLQRAGIQLATFFLDPGRLFRRSIGRNKSALGNNVQLIWFTDADHYFGEGCLEELWTIWSLEPEAKKPALLWPNELLIHKSHKLGDELARSSDDLQLDPAAFEIKRYTRAIGGVQIANGAICRRHGYLHGYEKWQTPRTDGQPFKDFKDDVAFRHFISLEGPVKRIKLPNLFRLRHTLKTY